MNFSKFFNDRSLLRKLATTHLNKTDKNVLNFADILPNSNLFPFKSANLTLRNGATMEMNLNTTKQAMGNCPTAGNPDLIKVLTDFQKFHHNPLTNIERKMCITSGCQEGLCMAFEMMIDEGDDVLIESPTYSGILSALEPLGCNIVLVECDKDGIIPSRLEDTLKKLSSRKTNPPKHPPRFLYTVPNGGNPTGASTSDERKVEIYEMARRHDFLILEDDPYYFLQFNKPRLGSYLSMDVDGRVLRFDSFSKVLSSGIRVGYVTGPSEIMDHFEKLLSLSTKHASHFTQMLVLELLKEWGVDGFEQHVQTVVSFYSSQKDIMIKYANKHLKGLAEWSEPIAGMFLWMKLLGIEDTQRIIEEKAREKKVLFVPGKYFFPSDCPPSTHIRASYSGVDESRIDQGLKRLAEILKEERKLQ